ncbi:hypothetical protein RB195_014834 [Necator americanus]
MYGSEIWAAPSTVMERLDFTERKLLGRLLGYFWPKETGRSPCSTSFEKFVGFEPEEAPGRKRKFWTEAVKEDLRTLGVDRQFRRDVRFRRVWNSDEWIDSVQALAEDREGWAELCSRTAHLGEDAGNRVRDFDPEEKPGHGHRSSLDNEDLERAVEENPDTTRTLAEDLGVHHTTVVRHVAEISKVKKMSKWVPHEPTEEQRLGLTARVLTF